MQSALIYGLIYFGSGLMVYNIFRYVRFSHQIKQQGSLSEESRLLVHPIILLILFLIGYLMVGILGHPDLIIAGILAGGSVFVYLMILFLQVVTTRIYEHEHLEAKLLAAEDTNRAKTRFLSTISHEMRTPMNAIIGLAVMALKDPSISQHTSDHLEKIVTSARHLLGLVNDVLEMNQIEAGRLMLREEPLVLTSAVEQISVIISVQCAEKGLEYRSEIIGDVYDFYLGDDLKLKQILLSILSNAIKFTPSPGSILFTVEQLSSEDGQCMLRFQVKDTGIGISEEFLPHVFDTFATEDSSSTTAYGGSGLGLVISKNIAEIMHGTITVESAKGVGSTFTVTVPLKLNPDGAAADAEESQAESVSLEGLRVLVVEDMEINADLVIELLDLEGVACTWAENGQIAVDTFRDSQPGSFDAVLMDIRMPVMDGLEATRTIRSLDHPDAKRVPIIALTANAFEEDVNQALSAGMDFHLSKPVDPDLLYQTLGRLVLQQRKS